MGVKDVEQEVLNSKQNDLKIKVDEVFRSGGRYIIFMNKNSLNKKQIDERINVVREVLKKLKKDYSDSAKIDIYDLNKITAWVNHHSTVANFVLLELLGIDYSAFYSWETWKRITSKSFSNNFIGDEGIDSIMRQVKNVINEGGHQRIIGLSGLGKSRLVFELIKSSEELAQKTLYSNTADYSSDNILFGIGELLKNNEDCILVLDNCDLNFHRRIIDIIQQSRIRLISINNDMSKKNDEHGALVLNPDKYKNIIPKILLDLFPDISENDLKKITIFSMGFPLIAVLLGKDRRSGSIYMGRLNDGDLIDHLLGIEALNDNDVRKILMSISIFDRLGFKEEFSDQRIAVSRNPDITRLDCSEKIAEQKFYEVIRRYIDVGIIEVVGRYIFIKPIPLALRLAEEWWKYCPPEHVANHSCPK